MQAAGVLSDTETAYKDMNLDCVTVTFADGLPRDLIWDQYIWLSIGTFKFALPNL